MPPPMRLYALRGATTVTVTTSSRVAGRGAGTLRLAVAGASWMYRDYPLTIAEADEHTTDPGIGAADSECIFHLHTVDPDGDEPE